MLSQNWNVPALALSLVLAALGSVLAVYAGIAAGLTLTVTLPSALLSLFFLSWLLKRGGAPENVFVQTVASAAVTAATAAVFVAPSFLVSEHWKEVPFWQLVLMMLGGGISGVLFATHFRRSWSVRDGALPFPEAEACGRLLLDAAKAGPSRRVLGAGFAVGALVKTATALVGVLRSSIEVAWSAGRTVLYAVRRGRDVGGATWDRIPRGHAHGDGPLRRIRRLLARCASFLGVGLGGASGSRGLELAYLEYAASVSRHRRDNARRSLVPLPGPRAPGRGPSGPGGS
jgi:hypothetical protein